MSNKEQKLASIFSKRLRLRLLLRDESDFQYSHFLEQIKSNQENNEIINKENWPDLNVDKNKKTYMKNGAMLLQRQAKCMKNLIKIQQK